MRISAHFSLMLCLITFAACNKDKNQPKTTNIVQTIRVLDIANNGNAADLLVFFNLLDPGIGNEVRIALSTVADFPTVDAKMPAQLSSAQYTSKTISGRNYEVALLANMTDIKGNPIENNKEYYLIFMVVSDGTPRLDENNKKIKLSDVHYLEGRYTGTWNDNLYTNFGISAELTYANGKLSGPFYYDSKFISCCGGQNDGRITVELKDNLVITSFVYSQDLLNFMGGCTGTYSGNGQVSNRTQLQINFAGTDCEGPHTNGRILLKLDF